MSEKKPDHFLLTTDDLDADALNLEARAESIADVLANGEPSRLFLTILADMVRPSGNKSPYKFELRHSREGRPQKTDWRVGYEMARMVDDEGMKVDVAFRLIQERLGKKGNGRSKCMEAMAAARKDIQAAKRFERMVKGWSPEND